MATVKSNSTATSSKRRAISGTASTPYAEILPNPEFRPDPKRAIFITGPFNQDLVYRLTPDIVRLQHESREPITVYIDSPGGIVANMRGILRLLRLPGMDSPAPCNLITVATSLAASAAATLLCSGDYVIACPGSLIHFHGVRTYRQTEITKEDADDVARDLKASNDASAVSLARARSQQFFYRFITLRSDFEEYRKKNPRAITDKDCFVGMISERLSAWGTDLVRKAEERYKRYDSLSTYVFKARRVQKELSLIRSDPKRGNYKRAEAEMLKAIIAFEVPRKQSVGWTFGSDGLPRVNDDFFLLNEYIDQHSNSWIEAFCEAWKDFILNDSDKAAIEALPEDQRKAARLSKLTPVLLPLWLFFGSICRVLQEAENPLTPEDAFWLGLVDEVMGANLPTLRRMVERIPLLKQE